MARPPKLWYTKEKEEMAGGSGMLEKLFVEVYTKFKLHFYQEIFERFQNREASLTTVETFAMETIQALDLSLIHI